MSIFADFESRVLTALETMQGEGELPPGLDFSNVVVELARDASHGDIAINFYVIQ